jgi:hypothetical protein
LPEEENSTMAHFDLSTHGAETVTRIVRPFNNIGPACGGDEVTLDATELLQQPIADALWTSDELREAERRAEEERRARMRSPTDGAAKMVNDQMAKAVEERKRRKAKEKVEEVAKAKEMIEVIRGAAAQE